MLIFSVTPITVTLIWVVYCTFQDFLENKELFRLGDSRISETRHIWDHCFRAQTVQTCSSFACNSQMVQTILNFCSINNKGTEERSTVVDWAVTTLLFNHLVIAECPNQLKSMCRLFSTMGFISIRWQYQRHFNLPARLCPALEDSSVRQGRFFC